MRIELNLTLACNLACPQCNRFCDRYRNRSEHMAVRQVGAMLEELRGRGVGRLKVAGGEPLLHPDRGIILRMLSTAAVVGIVRSVKVDSNGAVDLPAEFRDLPGLRIGGRGPARKRHLPACVAPRDLKIAAAPCSMPRRCGFSLDRHGWLPCSAAIGIVRAFHLDHLYRPRLPRQTWGLDELCPLCVFGMPQPWKDVMCRPLGEVAALCTPSWERALAASDGTSTAPPYAAEERARLNIER